jgi:SPP1 family predicted phage head-tail adaptor
MDAGTLRERVSVMQGRESRSRLNEVVMVYDQNFAVQGVSSREYLQAGQQQVEISHRVKMRYLPGLTAQMRLSWRGRTLEIISVLEHENRSVHELICQEIL